MAAAAEPPSIPRWWQRRLWLWRKLGTGARRVPPSALEHQPGALAVQIVLQAVRVAVAARKRRECDVAVLPAAHHLPLLHPAGGIDQR